nr:MAG TPA: hypothetical protein [Caudoviricetes sp.]
MRLECPFPRGIGKLACYPFRDRLSLHPSKAA